MLSLNYLSLRDLEYVVSVADCGSFAHAAKQCGVSPPSLSAQVKRLEASISVSIFERTTRRVHPTKEGQGIIDQARRVLAEARNLLLLADGSNLPFGGRLKLAAISTLGPYYFPLVLPTIRDSYSTVKLSLEEGFTHDLLGKLIAGMVDGVLLSLPCSDPSLTVVPLFNEPFLLAKPKGTSTLEADEDRPLLLLDDVHCLQGQAIAACSTHASDKRHATSLETLKYMVAAGEGCTVIPALAVSPTDPVMYSPMSGANGGRTIALAWRRSDPHADDLMRLAAVLRAIEIPGTRIPS